MVAVAKEVGAHRYRESYGRYFEDLRPAISTSTGPGALSAIADNTRFTLLTMNQHPLHFDAAYASKSDSAGRSSIAASPSRLLLV
jgi:itaconyl-CoA hydratase